MAVIYGPNLWFLTILSSNLLFCLLSPVFRHQCGGGHSGDGWGPWYDLRSAGGPFTSPQHLQLSEGCQQPPQHPDQPPTAPPASLPRGHTHLLRLWGWARKDWKTGHPKGKCLSSLKMCFVFFFSFHFCVYALVFGIISSDWTTIPNTTDWRKLQVHSAARRELWLPAKNLLEGSL